MGGRLSYSDTTLPTLSASNVIGGGGPQDQCGPEDTEEGLTTRKYTLLCPSPRGFTLLVQRQCPPRVHAAMGLTREFWCDFDL